MRPHLTPQKIQPARGAIQTIALRCVSRVKERFNTHIQYIHALVFYKIDMLIGTIIKPGR